MIRLDHAQAVESLRLIHGTLAGLYNELSRLDGKAANLREQWAGDPQQAYEAAHSRWEKQTPRRLFT